MSNIEYYDNKMITCFRSHCEFYRYYLHQLPPIIYFTYYFDEFSLDIRWALGKIGFKKNDEMTPSQIDRVLSSKRLRRKDKNNFIKQMGQIKRMKQDIYVSKLPKCILCNSTVYYQSQLNSHCNTRKHHRKIDMVVRGYEDIYLPEVIIELIKSYFSKATWCCILFNMKCDWNLNILDDYYHRLEPRKLLGEHVEGD